ncbi:MAG: hypothetical protein IJC09_05910 [Clostridia bacterium]|nr:hypothetical protein [Clostridia bacterium]
MGIFNRYLKEGPGIDKNAPKKKGIFLFAELVGRKFFLMLRANALYSLVSIPFFLVSLFFLAPVIRSVLLPAGVINDAWTMIMMDVFFTGFLFTFFGSGPASASYAFVTRSFTRSEHVWIASDGRDIFKENFKYSMLLLIIDIAVIYLAMNAVAFYGMNAGGLSVFLRFFIMVLFALYAISHMFAYQIMVTYECKFFDIIKYSLTMTLAKLPMCILLSVIAGAVWVLMWYYLGIIGVILYLIVGLIFSRYPLEFYAARVIEKNIAKTQPEKEADDGDDE